MPSDLILCPFSFVHGYHVGYPWRRQQTSEEPCLEHIVHRTQSTFAEATRSCKSVVIPIHRRIATSMRADAALSFILLHRPKVEQSHNLCIGSSVNAKRLLDCSVQILAFSRTSTCESRLPNQDHCTIFADIVYSMIVETVKSFRNMLLVSFMIVKFWRPTDSNKSPTLTTGCFGRSSLILLLL